MNKRFLARTLLAIPFVLVFESMILISEKQPDRSVAEVFMGFVVGTITHPERRYFVFTLEGLLYIFLFQILFGSYIYQEFRYSNTYVFSRISGIGKWFMTKSLFLGFFTGIYVFLYLGTFYLLALYHTGNPPDLPSWILLIKFFVQVFLVTFTGTMLINILSLSLGNTLAYLVVYGLQIMEVYIIMSYTEIPILNRSPVLLKFFPFSSLVINTAGSPPFDMAALTSHLLISFSCFFFCFWKVKQTDVSLVKYH